jgi:CHAD domain-containing protein
MAFRLTRRGSLTDDARRLADDELGSAIDRLGDAGTAADLRIHGARKSIKRVRALLRLVRAALPPGQFRGHNAALRDAARGLSEARDAAVALATFDALVPEPDDLLIAVRNDLVARTAPTGPTGASAPAGDILRLAADALAAVRPRVNAGIQEVSWSTLAAGLKDSYAGGRAAMCAAFGVDDPDDEAFHAWRKRAKDLWYQCQLLQGASPELIGGLEQLLARLGDQLGEDHDLAVLQAAAPASPALQARIAERHAELRAAALSTGERIYAERPRAFVRRMRAYWRAWRDEPAE